MRQLLLLSAMSYLAASCAVSGPTPGAAKPTVVAGQGKLQTLRGETALPGEQATSEPDAGVPELNGLGFDSNPVGPRYNDPNVRQIEEPQSPDTMSDTQFEESVEGLLEAKAREQKRTELIVANEKSHPVRRVQTDGIFGYFGCNGMGVRECEAGLILDNGIGYRWHSVEGDYETMAFDVPTELRHKLANVVNGADMLGRRLPAKPCPRDVGSQYLFLARHNVSSGRLAQCAQPGSQELTNSGFYTLASTFMQFLDSVKSGKLQGRRIDFNTMNQGVRDYLERHPGGDVRNVQVASWLTAVTQAMTEVEDTN